MGELDLKALRERAETCRDNGVVVAVIPHSLLALIDRIEVYEATIKRLDAALVESARELQYAVAENQWNDPEDGI